MATPWSGADSHQVHVLAGEGRPPAEIERGLRSAAFAGPALNLRSVKLELLEGAGIVVVSSGVVVGGVELAPSPLGDQQSLYLLRTQDHFGPGLIRQRFASFPQPSTGITSAFPRPNRTKKK